MAQVKPAPPAERDPAGPGHQRRRTGIPPVVAGLHSASGNPALAIETFMLIISARGVACVTPIRRTGMRDG